MNCGARDMEDDSLHSSISDLVATFRQALLALTPFAERLKMNWRDGHQHRHWESMAEAVFDACVRGPIESDAGRWEDELPLPRYDIDDIWYPSCSWIVVDSYDDSAPLVFVRLVSDREPFDMIQAVSLDVDTLAPIGWRNMQFDHSSLVFVRRSGTRSNANVYEIEAVE